MTGVRVEVVPDDDAQADPRIPKDVLAALQPGIILTGWNMLYVRQADWEGLRTQMDRAGVLTRS